LSLRIIESDAATTRALRRAVLRPTWPADAVMHGDDNPHAIHLAAYKNEELVAACLILPQPFPPRPEEQNAWQLRGMATVPRYRSDGIGAQLLAQAVDVAELRGGRLLWCEARTTAMRFYAKHGFTVVGSEYLHSESHIPHHLMVRSITAKVGT
jgi:predicted GNAT family N-acyltransferase